MYEQVEKPKENKSKAVANSVYQKKNNVKQKYGFEDNRIELIKGINQNSQAKKHIPDRIITSGESKELGRAANYRMEAPIQRMANEKESYQKIAKALETWLRNWTEGGEETAIQRVEQHWQLAAYTYRSMLEQIGFKFGPFQEVIKENMAHFNIKSGTLLGELLTPPNDIENFGENGGLSGRKTFETIGALHGGFSKGPVF